MSEGTPKAWLISCGEHDDYDILCLVRADVLPEAIIREWCARIDAGGKAYLKALREARQEMGRTTNIKEVQRLTNQKLRARGFDPDKMWRSMGHKKALAELAKALTDAGHEVIEYEEYHYPD